MQETIEMYNFIGKVPWEADPLVNSLGLECFATSFSTDFALGFARFVFSRHANAMALSGSFDSETRIWIERSLETVPRALASVGVDSGWSTFMLRVNLARTLRWMNEEAEAMK